MINVIVYRIGRSRTRRARLLRALRYLKSWPRYHDACMNMHMSRSMVGETQTDIVWLSRKLKVMKLCMLERHGEHNRVGNVFDERVSGFARATMMTDGAPAGTKYTSLSRLILRCVLTRYPAAGDLHG